MYDIIIVGSGPAGLSAAITARQRDKTVAVISNKRSESGLYKAIEIPNYPGLPGISGPELSSKMLAHALGMGAELIAGQGQVNAILPLDGVFHVGYGANNATSKSIILATGVAQTSLFPGEAELLGNGVSYCATCDGMLFRGKRVCVICLAPGADEEAEYLSSIGCDVIRLRTKKVKINGEARVTSVTADGEEIECDGVFILRPAIAPHLLLPGLETKGGHIQIDRTSGATNIPGVYAAGDCIGAPYQIAKAVGEGLVASLSAAEYVTKI